jgi:hypothetical protein
MSNSTRCRTFTTRMHLNYRRASQSKNLTSRTCNCNYFKHINRWPRTLSCGLERLGSSYNKNMAAQLRLKIYLIPWFRASEFMTILHCWMLAIIPDTCTLFLSLTLISWKVALTGMLQDHRIVDDAVCLNSEILISVRVGVNRYNFLLESLQDLDTRWARRLNNLEMVCAENLHFLTLKTGWGREAPGFLLWEGNQWAHFIYSSVYPLQ